MKKENKITTEYRNFQEMMNNDETGETWSCILTINTEVLTKAAKGEIDLNSWAKIVLANRGLNSEGKWVGFPEARKHFKIQK